MPAELGPFGPIRSPETVANLDILDLINRIDYYMGEVGGCASATRHETSKADSKRWLAMINRFQSRFDGYTGDPELDMPKYHPEPLRVAEPPALNRVQNADASQLMHLWAALRIEIGFSDSSEREAGFKPAEADRISPVLHKIAEYIQDVIANPEIDLPSVDPQEPPANKQK